MNIYRFTISAAAGIGAGVVAAIALAVLELYLSGNGHASIMRELIRWDSASVHLSLADLVLLLAVFATAALTWTLQKR